MAENEEGLKSLLMRVKLGFVLVGGAMLSKSLIQFSIDGWGCVPSLLFQFSSVQSLSRV